MPGPKIGWADASKRAGPGKRYTNEQQASKDPKTQESDSGDRSIDCNTNLQPLGRLVVNHTLDFLPNRPQSRAFGSGTYENRDFIYPAQSFGHVHQAQNINFCGATPFQQQPYFGSGNYTYGGSTYYPAVQVRHAWHFPRVTH